MATEHFCLRWNNHQSTLVSVFDNLLESGTLVDCTLAADGRYLKAHKVVLSACSPYLGMLLSQHYDKHPIIILKDVKFDELKAMLDYMYRGEVNISQEQLSTFLKAAETLQIKGLTDAGSDEGNGILPNRPPSSNSTTSANEDPQSPGPPGEGGSSPGPRKRKRNKHGDDGEGDSVSKISLSEGSDRLSGTSVGSPSAKSASVKREPADGEGDGQISVDDSGEVVMMSRPGPSNGGTNNKAPWILSADSSGEEMQLTPGQDGRLECLGLEDQEIKKEVEDSGNGQDIKEVEIKNEIIQEGDPFAGEVNSWEEENGSNTGTENPMVYTNERSEDELIIPDPLGEPTLMVNGLPLDYYQRPAESIYHPLATRRDEDKSEDNNVERHNFEDINNFDYQLVQGVPSTVEQSIVERSTNEESLIRVREYLKTKHVKVVPKSSSTTLAKSQPSSVTVINLGDNQTQLICPPQICFKSSPSPLKCSKTVVDIADAFDKNKVQVKKTKLDFHTSKYRKILPATEENLCNSDKGSKYRKILPAKENNSYNASKRSNTIQNVQPAMPPNTEKQSTNPSRPQCSTSPENLYAEIVVDTSACIQQNNTYNQQQTQEGLMTNSSLSPSMLSIPQPMQVGQVRNPNPSTPQQHHGSQIVHNTPNVFSVPQNVQSNQINNSNSAMLSIAPQFSMSPIQAGNIRMRYSNNTNIQPGNFQNTQFFTNTDAIQNEVANNQNSVLTQHTISHPVFVTSNIISSCQTSNQFLPSTSVHYNFNTAQPNVQPNSSVPISQPENPAALPSIIPSTSACATSRPAVGKNQSVYVRTPCGFVHMARLTSEENTAMKNTQFVRGRGTFSSCLRGRGRPPGRGRRRFPPPPPQRPMLLPKPKPILPKK